MRFKLFALLFGLLGSVATTWADTFDISDIRLEGLQRVSAGTVFEIFPLEVGEQATDAKLVDASRRLFKLGLFDDIKLLRDGNVLIVQLVELPTITKIEIKGNKAIQTDMLLDGLKQSGLAEGLVFKRSTLDRIALELERQYVAQGRYDAHISTEVEALPRNRVALHIDVKEGSVANIEGINIIGNQAFDTATLRKQLQLQTAGFWSWYSSDNKYSREKLAADLETLRSFYLDRGYIRFNIESTQVSISPDKEGVYITINVSEGEVYNINEIGFAGKLIFEEDVYNRLLLFKKDDTFSRRLVTYSSELMSKRLGGDGYTFAKVDGIPKINDENLTVDLTFFVEPGKRTYVRNLNFTGNESTLDEVLRREMVQMEGGWASTDKIDLGKTRLDQLGFFKTVNVDTPLVPGTDDMIDVNYDVEEQLSGSLNFNIGYAGSSGVILGASVSQNNFLGTGNRMSLGIQRNDYMQAVTYSFLNPYYTIDGVSRGFNLFYRKTDYSKFTMVSDYQTNVMGGNLTYGYPISNRQRLSFSLGYSNTEVLPGVSVPYEIVDFIDNNGTDYDEYTLGLTWRYSSLNRGLFPTAGTEHRISGELAVPGSDLTWYKLGYTMNHYLPLATDWTLRLRTDLGYGGGYGDVERYPFYKNFRAGGVGSIRGWRANSLGPQGLPKYTVVDLVSTDSNGVPEYETDNLGRPIIDAAAPGTLYIKDSKGEVVAISNPNKYKPKYDSNSSGEVVTEPYYLYSLQALGGNILIETSLELIFPIPFIEDRSSIRSVLFLDAGNTFTDQCYKPNDPDVPGFTSHPFCHEGVNLNEMRYSTGIGLTWITAIGPLTFTYSFPLNDKDNDRTEGFEFSLGQVF